MTIDDYPLIYIATMYRHGDDERHSYLLGVYATSHRARIEAMNEENERGGKYEARIVEMRFDWNFDMYYKVVKQVALAEGIKPWMEIATEYAKLTIPDMAMVEEVRDMQARVDKVLKEAGQ